MHIDRGKIHQFPPPGYCGRCDKKGFSEWEINVSGWAGKFNGARDCYFLAGNEGEKQSRGRRQIIYRSQNGVVYI